MSLQQLNWLVEDYKSTLLHAVNLSVIDCRRFYFSKDWSNSWFDRFIVDDFQLVYFHDQELVVHSFAPEV